MNKKGKKKEIKENGKCGFLVEMKKKRWNEKKESNVIDYKIKNLNKIFVKFQYTRVYAWFLDNVFK